MSEKCRKKTNHIQLTLLGALEQPAQDEGADALSL
jgi:hypothetical protein